jgi:hypothetical protein
MLLPPLSMAAIAPTMPVVANDTQEPQRAWSVTGPITPLLRQSKDFGSDGPPEGPPEGPPATPASSAMVGSAATPPNAAARRVVLSRTALACAGCSRAGGVGSQPRPRNSLGAGSRATHWAPAAVISARSLLISSMAIGRSVPVIGCSPGHSGRVIDIGQSLVSACAQPVRRRRLSWPLRTERA